MRRVVVGSVLSLVLLAGVAMPSTASAHVHGITPLLGLGCHVDFAIAGGNATDGTPAAAANGGPIVGLIPRDTRNAPVGPGTRGFGKTTANC